MKYGNDIRFMEGQGKNIKAQEKERNILGWCGREKMSRFSHLQINIEEAEMSRFEKAYLGVMETAGMTLNIQEAFHAEGYFKAKVTPLEANLCLLEEQDEGEIKDLIEEAKDWVGQWFSDIHCWSPKDVDNERLTWMSVMDYYVMLETIKCLNSFHVWWVYLFVQMMKHVNTKEWMSLDFWLGPNILLC